MSQQNAGKLAEGIDFFAIRIEHGRIGYHDQHGPLRGADFRERSLLDRVGHLMNLVAITGQQHSRYRHYCAYLFLNSSEAALRAASSPGLILPRNHLCCSELRTSSSRALSRRAAAAFDPPARSPS